MFIFDPFSIFDFFMFSPFCLRLFWGNIEAFPEISSGSVEGSPSGWIAKNPQLAPSDVEQWLHTNLCGFFNTNNFLFTYCVTILELLLVL